MHGMRTRSVLVWMGKLRLKLFKIFTSEFSRSRRECWGYDKFQHYQTFSENFWWSAVLFQLEMDIVTEVYSKFMHVVFCNNA